MTTSSGTCVIDEADTSWVLVSSILVLGMSPGLAFFEAGLLQSKNKLSIMTQIFTGLCILSFMWNLFGYSLTFDGDYGGVIGGLSKVVLINVSYFDCYKAPNGVYAQSIPEACFAIFMMMFASITPLLMTGSFAERLKFKSFIVITIFWEILVYYPVAHWIWGYGWLAQLGALDFAGGIVIHTTAGVGALVIALMLGRRRNFAKYHGEFPPSSIMFACLGAALLWIGWFCFNGGSALIAGSLSTSAVVSTQAAGTASGIVWLALSWFQHKPMTTAVLNGVIAGLAGITPASGYVNTPSSLVIGLILGVVSYFAVILFKGKLKIDDALDVSSVHGITGIVGSLAIGFCAEKALNAGITEDGLFFGEHSARLLGVQTLAVVVAGVYSGFWTFVICFIVDKIFGLRVSEAEEIEGLDRHHVDTHSLNDDPHDDHEHGQPLQPEED